MFKVTQNDKGRAENERGVVIEFPNRYSLEYRIESKKLLFFQETDEIVGGTYYVHLPEKLNWGPPHENESITTEEVETVKRDIAEAIKILCPNSKGTEFIYK